MPAYSEMLISQSPPTYGHSPLSDYNSYLYSRQPTNFCRNNTVQVTPPVLRKHFGGSHLKIASPLKKSCLKSPESTPEEEKMIEFAETLPEKINQTQVSLPNQENKKKKKKHVVFADDRGLNLEQVRVMKEPSYMPPLWSLQFLAHVTQGLISPVPPEQWVVDFRQPASDYLHFRHKLDKNMVSLENVIIKEAESTVVGTVKVRNLSFQKEVIVRSSCDNWHSQEDTFCTYTMLGASNLAYVLYDTFSFKLTLPPTSRKLEFCVCFRSDGVEHWDNNSGTNYSLTNRKSPKVEPITFPSIQKPITEQNNRTTKYTEASHTKLDTWSEFAAWEHLENNAPYWNDKTVNNSYSFCNNKTGPINNKFVVDLCEKTNNEETVDEFEFDEGDIKRKFTITDLQILLKKIKKTRA